MSACRQGRKPGAIAVTAIRVRSSPGGARERAIARRQAARPDLAIGMSSNGW
jgi:hypothetical protein